MAHSFEDDPSQQIVFKVIRDALMAGKIVPTLAEIEKSSPIAKPSVAKALDRLEENGYIERDFDKNGNQIPRAIRLARMSRTRYVPVLGQAAAGRPIPVDITDIALADVEEHVPLPTSQARGSYALRVRGDSMLGDHIRDGDYVVVANDIEPGSEEIVVVLVDGEATLKRIRTEGDTKSLESSNPDKDAYPPIPVDRHDEFLTQGCVVGVIRWLH